MAKIQNSNTFSHHITTSTSRLWYQISFGGAVFNFSPKIGLKSNKNVRFCILHKPMGGLEPPLPPSGYATGQDGKLAYLPMLSFLLQDFALRIFRYIISITNHFRVRSSPRLSTSKNTTKIFQRNPPRSIRNNAF